MERFIFCFFVALLSFAASSVNAAYSTLASASTSLSSYYMPYSGVLIASKTLQAPNGPSFNIYAAVSSSGVWLIGVKTSAPVLNGAGLEYATGATASVPTGYASAFYYDNAKSHYFEVSHATPYIFLRASYGGKSTSAFMVHFPTIPSSTELIDVSTTLDASGSASVKATAETGGKVYIQVRKDGEWVTVQVQNAPTSTTSYTYTANDVSTWLGSTQGVDAVRAVTYTSAGVYAYNSEAVFSGSGALSWTTEDNQFESLSPIVTDSITFSTTTDDQYLIYGSDGTLSYGANGTGANTSNSTSVSVTGTATDQLSAANTQTGVLRQTLAATASTNSTLLDIASDVDTIAENSDSSEGASADGGLSDADSALLENIDKNVQDAADRQAAFDEMTGYDREDSMADIIADARDALVSAVSGAQDEAASALASKGLAGSDKSAGNTSPSGSSNFWQINLPWGAQLKFDPASVSEIATILYAVRAALGWIFLGWFYQWFVPRLREAYQTIILTPTPVANTNPAGLVGAATNATKVVIWVAVLVSIPSLVSGILDTSSAISGFTGMVSWRDTNPIQEVSTASTPLGAAVKLVGCVFPVATVLNLFVLYVTAELFMTTFVYLMIFANKHITSY